MLNLPSIPFDNSYARELNGFYVPWKGTAAPAPMVLRVNEPLAVELGLDPRSLTGPGAAALLSGGVEPDGGMPLAMAYAGHQFGGFSPQLGDGRAVLLGELIDRDGMRRDIQLKGSGPTPFSRGGDGKAVLGPMLREYLCGEAMHALGIATTRALAITITGEKVRRGRSAEVGAVLTRVAASHIRVGTFQFFSARGEIEKVRQLADYTIQRHFPEIADKSDRYLELFRRVRDSQARLIASWVLVGFVHGVMNTDNTSISGETIDYGPCAFIDAYDPNVVYSSVDEQGRYAYGKQPTIMQWNLARFAETLIELVNPNDNEDAIRQLTNELNAFPAHYQLAWLDGMRRKLGLLQTLPEDIELANDLLAAAEGQNVDYTMLFRALADFLRGSENAVRQLFTDTSAIETWLNRYRRRSSQEDIPTLARAEAMDRVNPVYIPRNHMVGAALKAAETGDMTAFDRLLGIVSSPFTVKVGAEEYARPAPEGSEKCVTFCGT